MNDIIRKLPCPDCFVNDLKLMEQKSKNGFASEFTLKCSASCGYEKDFSSSSKCGKVFEVFVRKDASPDETVDIGGSVDASWQRLGYSKAFNHWKESHTYVINFVGSSGAMEWRELRKYFRGPFQSISLDTQNSMVMEIQKATPQLKTSILD